MPGPPEVPGPPESLGPSQLPGPSGPLGPPHLGPDDFGVYAAVIRQPGADLASVAAASGLEPPDAAASLDMLASCGLIVPDGAGSRAPMPEITTSRLARARFDHLDRRTRHAIDLLNLIDPLSRELRTGRRATSWPLTAVRGLDGLVHTLSGLATHHPPHDVAAYLGPPMTADAVVEVLRGLREIAVGGTARIRAVLAPQFGSDGVHADAVNVVNTVVRELAESGGEVRIGEAACEWFAVVSPEYLLISGGDDEALVVGATVLADAALAVFAQLWRASRRGGAEATRADADPVPALLAEGLTDAAIARRLDVSVRTVQSRVAALMAELGADSRFQAGYLAGLRERQEQTA